MCGSFNQTGSDCSSSIDSDEELCIIEHEGREAAYARNEISFLTELCMRTRTAISYNSKSICSSYDKLNV